MLRTNENMKIGTSLIGVAVMIVTFSAPAVPAQVGEGMQIHGGEPLLPDPMEMKRVEAAVDKALVYLTTHQRPDGSWPSGFGNNNGINSICLLAFMGRGHLPGRGPFKHVVDRGVNFLMASQDDSGLFRSPNPNGNGPMYEHGLSTLAMIEAYGYRPSTQVRSSAQRGVDLIVKAQHETGGWRYQPVPVDHDLSVTVMQIVALRAAQNARLHVPETTTQKALNYVKACVVPGGGFDYQPGKNAPEPARSAAGVLSMQLLGAFDDPAVEKGLNYLHSIKYQNGIGHFYYMNYYAMQAAFQAGGNHWERWHPKVRRFLLENQNEDGSWPGYGSAKHNGPARCYSTGFSAICLEVYMHFLPAYQR